MTEKGTQPRKTLTWGKGETEKHVPKERIIAGWVCVLFTLVFMNVPFLSAWAPWILLAIAISLIRDENKFARINGWVFLPLFALKLLAYITYFIVAR